MYTLVGDYGYETLKQITYHRLQPEYFPFTQIIIAYWILVSAVLLLNIFIALMSGEFKESFILTSDREIDIVIIILINRDKNLQP